MIESYFESVGGVRIFSRLWLPEGQVRGMLVICHGVNSHSGQYLWPAQEFTDKGFAVYALDLRGRGKSDGESFYIADVSEYVADVARQVEIAKAEHPGLPVFLLGHGAGGVVSCLYAVDHQEELAGLICESLAFEMPAPGILLSAIKALSYVAPRLRVLRLKNEDFTRDPEALEALAEDPLIFDEVQPARTVAALVRAGERLKKEFSKIKIPVLILHGTADRATLSSGSQLFYETAGSPDKTLKLYEGHYHDLLNDLGKEDVVEDILMWLYARIPAEKGVRKKAVAASAA